MGLGHSLRPEGSVTTRHWSSHGPLVRVDDRSGGPRCGGPPLHPTSCGGFPMLRHLMALFVIALLALPGIASAQDVRPPENAVNVDTPRAATGGAQTLQDVLRREQGLAVDDSFRRNNIGGDAGTAPGLGPLGGTSDAEQWRALRYNEADVTVTTMDPRGKVLVQDGGMWWLDVRRGPLPTDLWRLAAAGHAGHSGGVLPVARPRAGRGRDGRAHGHAVQGD